MFAVRLNTVNVDDEASTQCTVHTAPEEEKQRFFILRLFTVSNLHNTCVCRRSGRLLAAIRVCV